MIRSLIIHENFKIYEKASTKAAYALQPCKFHYMYSKHTIFIHKYCISEVESSLCMKPNE
jgi:hypothetical protein